MKEAGSPRVKGPTGKADVWGMEIRFADLTFGHPPRQQNECSVEISFSNAVGAFSVTRDLLRDKADVLKPHLRETLPD